MGPSVFRSRLQPAAMAGLIMLFLTGAKGDSTKKRPAVILGRVLSYELTLEDRVGDSVGIAVVYRRDDQTSEANADDWIQGLAELSSVKVKDRRIFAFKVPYAVGEMGSAFDKGADVLLVADGLHAESPSIAQFARSRHLLTMGNAVSYLDTDLTLCVTEEGEKPKIFINLKIAHLEGIRFGSRLLELATLIR
jgi:hypothetical protein